MTVTVKGSYTILGNLYADSNEYPIQIFVPSVSLPDVFVEVKSDKKSIESYGEFSISNETIKFLKNKDSENIPVNIKKETSIIRSHLIEAARRALMAIKFCFRQIEIDEELLSIKGYSWSIDKNEWNEFYRGQISFVSSMRGFEPLNKNTAKTIENYLKTGQEPLFALRFLHKAKIERNPRYRWIDATIAAELAIKEFLIRLKPELEAVLLEVPSPPLHKLYGTILETYTGKRSPKVKEIANGAQVRNILVHKPSEYPVDDQKSMNYVCDVEAAIGHLIKMLYPELYKKYMFVDHYSL